MNTRLSTIKSISRIALGLVWFYEGLVPKILFVRGEIGLVQASHLAWRTPELTLRILGVAQMLVGLWLIIGLAERTARIHRDIVDVNLDRAGDVRKSVDADRSLRRVGERFLPDRMRDHGMGAGASRRRIAPGSFSLVTIKS